jgi:hypothetical protein
MGDSLKEIAVLLIGVAMVALLVSQSRGTAQVIQAGTSGFGNLLKIVTLQGGAGVSGGRF